MALFAQLNNNTISNVLVIPDVEGAHGDAFCAVTLGLGGIWIPCESAAVGDIYDPETGEIHPPEPPELAPTDPALSDPLPLTEPST
ncbi:hypothetical protein [Castellaniella caeni]|uniref:hypothetical protein n=1 Tax=Castellaniella caeni TaxID=266123 RepID=UPI0011AEFF20|nr:hypothetical protein [Castellaniella caeni]